MQLNKNLSLLCAIIFTLFFFSLTGHTELPNATESETETKKIEENRLLTNVRQLTYAGKRAGEGYFSEDGNSLIFQSERETDNPFYQIYILDLLTGESHRVSPGVGKTTCAFFRPGTEEILFASTHHDTFAQAKQIKEFELRASGKEQRYSWDYDVTMDIFSANRDGSNLKQLTDAEGYDAEGSYSPDGKYIVFCSLRDAYPKIDLTPKQLKQYEIDPSYFGEIYIMDADGSNQKRLTDSPGYDGGPFFTPDGQHIVWRHFSENGKTADIYTMRIDGSGVTRLTDFGSMSWAPFFHPSGAYVIFASNKLGFANFELFIVDSMGRHEPIQVTSTDGFDGLPVFSPDGSRLCWTSNRNNQKQSQLYLATWNHEAALEAISLSPRSSITRISEPIGQQINADLDFTDFVDDTKTTIQRHVAFLADDALEGRMSGSQGSKRAAEYIVKEFTKLGLQPAGEGGDFFQTFEFNAGSQLITDKNNFDITRKTNDTDVQLKFTVKDDFLPFSFSSNGDVEGEVVFVGYGIHTPNDTNLGYDSYDGIDVKDKIVVALRYVPETIKGKRRQQLMQHAGIRYKAVQAKKKGAKAFLTVAGPNSQNAGKVIPLSFHSGSANAGIIACSISDTIANVLFSQAGKDLKDVQTRLDGENPHFVGHFPIPNIKIKISAGIEKIKKTDNNVLAKLPPTNPTDFSEYIIIGGHYDHIGFGEIGSLAKGEEKNKIHNGADDNASGTAVVLKLAEMFSADYKNHPDKFKRGIIFTLWSGEELGLIGSTHFVNNPTLPLDNVAAYVNFDMVGRLRDNKLVLQGIGSSPIWTKIIEKRNVLVGLNLSLKADPYMPTDVTAFYPKNVPVLSFFTGLHNDYNRPSDDPETLNYAGMERISSLAYGMVSDLMSADERPEYVKVERNAPEQGSRASMHAYLGTIPDYTTEDIGVKLSGVVGGSPAEKARLKGGDVITEFGTKKIENIYDLTDALRAAKIGKPIDVVVIRDGKRVKLKVTPEAR